MKMASLPSSLRPREKALQKGIGSLGSDELLALLIGNGTKGSSALDIGRSLLCDEGDLLRVSRLSLSRLKDYPGLGKAKALILLGAFELGRRVEKEKIEGQPYSPRWAYRYFDMEGKEESLILLFLDKKKRRQKDFILYKGTSNSLLASPSEIKGKIDEEDSPYFVLIHFHPSGVPLPSREDLSFTSKLFSLCKEKMLDHLILSKEGYFSFANNGLL